MRILLVSDLHYVLPQFDWVVEQVPHHDLVVLAGDLLDISSAVPLDAQIAVLQVLLAQVDDPERVVIASGNHDLTGLDSAGERSALWFDPFRALRMGVDGDSVVVGDGLVTVCPWWDGPLGRERVGRQLAHDRGRAPEPWIWVYHWPPDRSPTCWIGQKHYGDAELRGWIEEHHPDVVLAGHVHQPPFRPDGAWADRIDGTWVFNAGRQIGPVPAHIEVDLEARRATWRSLLGVEVQPLDEAPILDRPSF